MIETDRAVFLAHLSTKPGVYRMLDASGIVLYVGKANNLQRRVSSYFKKSNQNAKTRLLMQQVASIEVTVTQSETEALLLESHLIKSLRPKYNVLMRDDKTYPYILLSFHDFPRIEVVRSKQRPKTGDYFGPFPSALAVKDTVHLIRNVFKLRNCSDTYFSARTRPCLQYQIKRCTAPCTKYISREEYQQSVKDAKRFLQGKCRQLLEELTHRMERAVAHLAFEEAASIRDQMKHLRLIQEQQGVSAVGGDADVIVLHAEANYACIQWVTIRLGQVETSQTFFPTVPEFSTEETTEEDVYWQEVFQTFIAFYYLEMPERIPALILTDHPVAERALLEETLSQLRGKSCSIQTNVRGVKARWIDLARNNLLAAMDLHRAKSAHWALRYDALANFLQLPTAIQRMECFDISHTQGKATVASCVVFDAHGPCKREYRCFNIEGIQAGDDYAAMHQVLVRRFSRMKAYPNLLIIDGGQGQVAVAKKVLHDMHIEGVALIGIAKGPSRKAGLERIILSDRDEEITLAADSPILHLLQHIRDEAHRFAITKHRKKRQKEVFSSSLHDIEGIGAKRRQALLHRFGGLRELAKASVEEIAKTQGISRSLAEKIYQHFQFMKNN